MQDVNYFDELFLSTDIQGWIGPIVLIVIVFMILSNKKYRPLGIFFIILESLIIAYYFTLVEETPWYWWNIFIMILGVITCMGQMTR